MNGFFENEWFKASNEGVSYGYENQKRISLPGAYGYIVTLILCTARKFLPTSELLKRLVVGLALYAWSVVHMGENLFAFRLTKVAVMVRLAAILI